MDIIRIDPDRRSPELINGLLEVWETSVRATHDFLEEKDIVFLRPFVMQGLREVPELFCAMEPGDASRPDVRPVAFLGMAEDSVEMLFVHAEARGRGIGSALMREVLARGARRVDVNEQNPQARGFYEHMGFKVVSRDALDSMGLPFPILHCALPEEH